MLDVGCGWGSFPLWAATAHGASVLGITLSPPQAERARQRAEEAGVADRVEIRVMDYRDLAAASASTRSPASAWSSTSATSQIDVYARTLAGLLEPGGRLLNHGIARLRHTDPEAGPFSERYVFPDAEPLHLSRVLLALERAGFVTRHVEELRRRLRRDAAPLGPAARREPRRGGAAGRARTGPRLAPLPARGAQRLRERLPLDLPGPLQPAVDQSLPHPGHDPSVGYSLNRGYARKASVNELVFLASYSISGRIGRVSATVAPPQAAGRTDWLEVIAEPVRLQILRSLCVAPEATAAELAAQGPASYQTLRRHLEALESAGVIEARAGSSDGASSGRPAARFSLAAAVRESVRSAFAAS